MIRFYNTLKRQKEDFVPLEEGKVRMYHCGPTVYARPHIGNYRAFLFTDLLRRFFEHRGWEVLQVMNLTDVDDKTIRGASEEGIPLREFTDRYVDIFFEDLDVLGVKRAHHYPRATEHIEAMVDLVKKIEEKGHTYSSEGSVYYKIDSFEEYGKLSQIDTEGLQAGARVDVDEYDKESARDFVLWKGWVEDDGDVFWETDFGKGRPGWHLECSAMSMEYLGETFDIHTGGIDLVFPHHENEIAQSEGATTEPFVKYWLHNEHFLLNDQKISKSKGNVITVPELLEKGFEGEVIRYALINSHYRTRFNFKVPESLESAREALKRLRNFRREMADVETEGEARGEVAEVIAGAEKDFEEALDDDLNTPEALGAIFGMIRKVNSAEPNRVEARLALEFPSRADEVLAVIGEPEKETLEDKEILDLIEERNQARAEKNFQRADEIRDLLQERGILLKDTDQGTKWVRQ